MDIYVLVINKYTAFAMTILRLKQISRKRKHKRKAYFLNQNDLNNLILYSITQNNFKDFKRFVCLGADVTKKQKWYHNKITPLELSLYQTAHSLFSESSRKMKTCLKFVKLIVENGAEVNVISSFFSGEQNLFMSLFDYINEMANERTFCTESFVNLFVLLLQFGANPDFENDLENSCNSLDCLCQFILFVWSEYIHFYLPLFHEMFIRGYSLIQNDVTYEDLNNDTNYKDIRDMFDDWPLQMLIYCFEMKCNGFVGLTASLSRTFFY